MDHKRDSRSQRVKNLQYKSRGRGRHLGSGHAVATDGLEGRTVGKENETEGFRAERSGASDRLGSNWDRYMEPGEDSAGTLDDGGVVEEVAKKQSEGLDYNVLLEEADALLSGGSISLLAHFDLDTEDLFQMHDVEEKPLPLNINLSILNEGLSCLSMAQRLGLEDELFYSQEEEEGATIDASEVGGVDDLREAGAYPKQQSPFSEPIIAPSKANEVGGRNGDPAGSSVAAPLLLKKSPQAPARGTSWSMDTNLEEPEFGSRRNSTEEAASGARQCEPSSSGRKQEEDADLLDMLLGRGDRAVKEGNGPTPSARPAAAEESLPERGKGSAVEESRGKLVTHELASEDSVLQQSGGGGGGSAQAEWLRGAQSDFDKGEAGRTGSSGGEATSPAAREADTATSRSQRGERASPAEDDIDALLAVLTPSASSTQAYVPADRAASNGGVVRRAVASAGPFSGAAPAKRLPESAPLESASQLGRGLKSGLRPERQSTAPVSARSKPTVPADQDFDAWLDSIS